jgi:hypothetical protein
MQMGEEVKKNTSDNCQQDACGISQLILVIINYRKIAISINFGELN